MARSIMLGIKEDRKKKVLDWKGLLKGSVSDELCI